MTTPFSVSARREWWVKCFVVIEIVEYRNVCRRSVIFLSQICLARMQKNKKKKKNTTCRHPSLLLEYNQLIGMRRSRDVCRAWVPHLGSRRFLIVKKVLLSNRSWKEFKNDLLDWGTNTEISLHLTNPSMIHTPIFYLFIFFIYYYFSFFFSEHRGQPRLRSVSILKNT